MKEGLLIGSAIKFIGDKEMVIPIVSGGFLLSHKDYINHYYPEIIEIVDSTGTCFKYQKATALEGVQWIKSIQKVNILHKIEPNLIEAPFMIDLALMKEKVCRFIEKTPQNRGLPADEKTELLDKVRTADSHGAVIRVIEAVSYWK